MIRVASAISRGRLKNSANDPTAGACAHWRQAGDNAQIMDAHPHKLLKRRDALCWVAACPLVVGVSGCGTPAVRPPVQALPGEPDAALAPREAVQAPAHAQAVAMHAMGLVGTPYRYGGNTPDAGFDCSGLIAYVHWEAARIRTPRSVAELSGWGDPVTTGVARTGDLAVFTVKGRTNHAGIYVGNGRFVHAPSTGGTVKLDRLDSGYWARQGISFRRGRA